MAYRFIKVFPTHYFLLTYVIFAQRYWYNSGPVWHLFEKIENQCLNNQNWIGNLLFYNNFMLNYGFKEYIQH